jgi:hypothetical protein
MLNLDMQFENMERVVDDIKLARFDVQDVIVADMEIFDDNELGMILVDPAGNIIGKLAHLLHLHSLTFLQFILAL